MAYCKYFNDDCYSPLCSAYPHSYTNRCPHIVASESELKQMDMEQKIHEMTTQEEIDEFNKQFAEWKKSQNSLIDYTMNDYINGEKGEISLEEAEEISKQIQIDYNKKWVEYITEEVRQFDVFKGEEDD